MSCFPLARPMAQGAPQARSSGVPIQPTGRSRSQRLSLDAFARAAGLHPDLVRRLLALGLLDAAQDAAGQLWFDRAQLHTVARIQRLRAGFGLNYAALGLVIDLLDRIAVLESALRARPRPPTNTGGRSWT